MAIQPKAIYRFNVIAIRLSTAFCTELEQIILKCMWNHKRPKIGKETLRNKNEAVVIFLSDFSLHYIYISVLH